MLTPIPVNETLVAMNNKHLLIFKKLLISSWFIPTLITLIGAMLRFYHLDFKALWLDEAKLYQISSAGNVLNVINENARLNSAPPLFAIFIRGILNFGDSELILRFLPMLAGVLSIPTFFIFANQFIGKTPAYLATTLVSISPTLIEYSQQLREYSLAFLLAILILLFFYYYTNKNKTVYLILLTIFMILGVLLQYGLALLIISLNLIYLFELIANKENRNKKLLLWSVSQIIVLLSVCIILILSLRQQFDIGFGASSTTNYLSSAYWDREVSSLFGFAFTKSLELLEFTFPGNFFLFLTVIGFISLAIDKINRKTVLLFLVPTAITFTLALVKLYPFRGGRQDLFLTPMIFILSAVGINLLLETKKKWIIVIFMLFPLIGGLISAKNYLNDPGVEDLRPAVNIIEQEYQSGENLYVYPSAKPAFAYYYRDNIDLQFIGSCNRGDISKCYQEIDELLTSENPTWFVFSHCFEEECEEIVDFINEKGNLVQKYSGNDAYLYYLNKSLLNVETFQEWSIDVN